MPDFTQYLPPGVYVEEEATPLVSVVGVSPTVVGIVGPAVNYRLFTEAITLTGTAPIQLAKLGINTATGFEVRKADGSLYASSDYAIVQAETGEAGPIDNATTLARSGASTITDGETVYVSYRYTDAEYGQPFAASDYDTVKEVFGEPINLDTGAIISPLSLAAKLAFENGAARVVLVATPNPVSATRSEIQTAYNKLATVPDVNIVVPLPVGITGTEGAPGDVINVATDLELHVVQSSDTDKVFRVGIFGTETSVTVDPVTLAQAVAQRRVAFVHPNKLLFYNGYSNQVLTVSGYYLAAAVAGRAASQAVQMPLTRKQIRGFAGLPSDVLASMSVTMKNRWSSSGVMVVETDRQQRLIVRHGVTTDASSVMNREISLVRAKDAMMQLLQETIEAAGLIGSTIDLETPVRVKGVVQGALETLVSSDVIVAYVGLKVRQQSVDPTVIEVKFAYRPAYPLNYITVAFQVDALTGETTLLDAA